MAESSPLASEACYRSLFDASPDAIILTDLDTRILMCNERAAALWGPGATDALIGRNAFEFIAPEDHERALANARKTLLTGSVRDVEYTLFRKDGSRFRAELSASLILDDQGAPQAFTAVVRDITERKRLEAELRQSEKLQSLGVMAAGVAHHINNVLAGVLGQADLLLESGVDESTRRRLLTIVEEAQRGAAAVHRMKQFAYDQPREPIQQVDLSALIRDVVAAIELELADRIPGAAIELVADIPDRPTYILGVAVDLREAFTNVVRNAVDALPLGGRISVELAERDEQVVLRVTDSGVGMPDTVLDRVYEPFFTTKPLRQGVGLGLAIAYVIVHQHGGRIETNSHEGAGTTVELSLRRAAQPGG